MPLIKPRAPSTGPHSSIVAEITGIPREAAKSSQSAANTHQQPPPAGESPFTLDDREKAALAEKADHFDAAAQEAERLRNLHSPIALADDLGLSARAAEVLRLIVEHELEATQPDRRARLKHAFGAWLDACA